MHPSRLLSILPPQSKSLPLLAGAREGDVGTKEVIAEAEVVALPILQIIIGRVKIRIKIKIKLMVKIPENLIRRAPSTQTYHPMPVGPVRSIGRKGKTLHTALTPWSVNGSRWWLQEVRPLQIEASASLAYLKNTKI